MCLPTLLQPAYMSDLMLLFDKGSLDLPCFVLICSVQNVYKVVHARNGSMLLALAMVLLLPFGYLSLFIAYRICNNVFFLFLVSFTLLLYSWEEWQFGMTQIYFMFFTCFSLKFADGFTYCYFFKCRDYLSPSDLIGNYPHLVILGTGLAFGFLVVRYFVFQCDYSIQWIFLFFFL